MVAINGARRALFHDMLVIADGKRPVAIAGIMGVEKQRFLNQPGIFFWNVHNLSPGRCGVHRK